MDIEIDGVLKAAKVKASACAIVCVLGWSTLGHAATWTKLTNAAPSGVGTMVLLTDGTVMVQGNPYDTWLRLSPSATGSYVDGTWSALAPMSKARLYFALNVLPSGKVWVLGGEYSGTPLQQNITNTGELYDPLANTWAPVTDFPEQYFGDDPSMLLPNGKILAGSIFTNQTYLYDIASNSWSFAGSKVYPDRSDEETWVKMVRGKVLTYDLFESVAQNGQYAETYDPTTHTWSSISPSDGSARGTIPALSSAAIGYELGPFLKIRGNGVQGQIFGIGATGHTALYSPSTNTWAPGPDVFGSLAGKSVLFGSDDAPGAVIPSGHVVFAADAGPTSGLFSPPTQLFDYDPVANSITPLSPSIPDSNLGSIAAFITRLLVLPNGQILFSDSSRQLWVYSPDGAPQRSWVPVFSNVKYSGAGVFTLHGVRMNGQSAGSSYGDDVESDENYPIVRLQDAAGHVYYGRTTNWAKTGVGQGANEETVDFTLKTGMVPGNYSIIVSGAGISSTPRCVTITSDQIKGVGGASNAAITCHGN
ncbi:hypothetical protein [Paraburkholderia sp. 40]|uniref:hypothetical protein n=1 Tax=Paraburkholderia sp. 40 TaxID=2991059 RepID=UPI003D1D4955